MQKRIRLISVGIVLVIFYIVISTAPFNIILTDNKN